MIDLAIDKRIAEFMDKWGHAFKSDADIRDRNPKTEAFFADAKALRVFLLQKGGTRILEYALRVMAAIPGLTIGLRQIFAYASNSDESRPHDVRCGFDRDRL